MNAKTSAELQLEFLRKLKEKQKSMQPRVQQKATRTGLAAKPAALSLHEEKQTRKRARRSLPLGEEAWRRLQEQGLRTGKFKLNQALGNWAVELILEVPALLQSLPGDAKADLFEKIRVWAETRGIK